MRYGMPGCRPATPRPAPPSRRSSPLRPSRSRSPSSRPSKTQKKRAMRPASLIHASIPLRAGMAQAVIAEIGARARVVRLEALGAIGIAAIGRRSLRLGNRTTDDGAGSQADGARCGGRAVIAAVIAAITVIAVSIIAARTVAAAFYIARAAAPIGTPNGASTIVILHIGGHHVAVPHCGSKLIDWHGPRLGGGSRSGKA